jgi:DNA-binding CsgD family transcriptional regulator
VKKADKGNSDRKARRVRRVSNPPDSSGESSLQDVMPVSDPAFPIVSGILKVVPASHWTYARVEPGGDLVSLFGSPSSGRGLRGLTLEFNRQREKASRGPRIAATLGPLDGFESGITLLFADAKADFGILTLLRTAELGRFTSSEISMLTFAVAAVSDRLSALRLQPLSEDRDSVDGTAVDANDPLDGAFYVLDSDLQIVLAWNPDDKPHVAVTDFQTRITERLPVLLEDTVRHLTASWSTETENKRGIAKPVSFLVVRTHPLLGPAGLFIGVRVDRAQASNSLTGAASRYHISPREVQVLALLLDGHHLDQIAKRLFITSSTVQDHIKSMLDKTGSHNRSELIARILGWEAEQANDAL